MTQPSTTHLPLMAHPPWCSPKHCELGDPDLPADGGFHRSDPVSVNLDLLISSYGRIHAATACVQQAAWPDTAVPFLHLALGPDTDLLVPLSQATEALHRLATLHTAVH